MNARIGVALPLLLLLVAPAAANAQEKTTPPTVVLRVSSLDSLIDHVKYLAGLAGQQDAARQIEGLIQNKIGQKGFDGVDSKRPFGFYGRIGKELDDISGAVLIPIADEDAFLALLKNLKIETVKGGDGIYTIKTGSPIDAYLRFAKKYAYVTALNTAALDVKNLLDPANVLAGKPTNSFSLTIQLDQVPEAAKLITTAQAEQVLQEIQDKKIQGESDAQKRFRVAALKEMAKFIATVLKDGAVLHAAVDINQKSGDLDASFSLSGVAKSDLAAGIEAIAKSSSMFAGLLKQDAVFNGLGHLKLPDGLAQALGDVLEEGRQTALANMQDATKKQQAEALFKVIMPTLKAADFDGAGVVTQTGKIFTFVGAFKLKDGDALGKTVHDLVADSIKDLPPGLKERIKLNADASGSTKIHKIELSNLGNDQTAKTIEALMGELTFYVAFRNDAMFYSLGKGGLDAIKGALSTPAGAAASPMVLYEVDLARLAFLAPPAQAAKAKELFPGGQGGTVRFTVEGGPALTVRLSTKVAVLQFLGQTREAKATGQ